MIDTWFCFVAFSVVSVLMYLFTFALIKQVSTPICQFKLYFPHCFAYIFCGPSWYCSQFVTALHITALLMVVAGCLDHCLTGSILLENGTLCTSLPCLHFFQILRFPVYLVLSCLYTLGHINSLRFTFLLWRVYAGCLMFFLFDIKMVPESLQIAVCLTCTRPSSLSFMLWLLVLISVRSSQLTWSR